jgi:hypothetical protein
MLPLSIGLTLSFTWGIQVDPIRRSLYEHFYISHERLVNSRYKIRSKCGDHILIRCWGFHPLSSQFFGTDMVSFVASTLRLLISWQSQNTLPTMVHWYASPIDRAYSILHMGRHCGFESWEPHQYPLSHLQRVLLLWILYKSLWLVKF